jgi:hypothetical protein
MTTRKRFPLLTFASAALAAIAMVSVTPRSVQARTFGAPVQLSQHGVADNASAGVDDAGNATAIWTDNTFYYSDHPRGGSWTAPVPFTTGANAAFAKLNMSAAGTATVVSWNSGYGVYAQDRPAGGAWGAPATLVNAPNLVTPTRTGAPSVIFLENGAGDAAVVYEVNNGGVQVAVVRRPAGGAWSAPEIVANSTVLGPISLAGAAIGAGGDVVVAWETFQVACQRFCEEVKFAVHASREPQPGAGWADSGPLTPESTAYITRAAIDPVGGAVLLIQPSITTTIQATRQKRAGGAWSAPVTAYTAMNQELLLWGVEASRFGRATALIGDVGSGPGVFEAIDGLIGSNAWGPGVDLTASDNPAPSLAIAYGASDAGGLAVAWVDGDGTMRAASRQNATTDWPPSQTLATGTPCNVGGVICTGAVGAAVGGEGHAVVLYIRLDPTLTIRTLYAATN